MFHYDFSLAIYLSVVKSIKVSCVGGNLTNEVYVTREESINEYFSLVTYPSVVKRSPTKLPCLDGSLANEEYITRVESTNIAINKIMRLHIPTYSGMSDKKCWV